MATEQAYVQFLEAKADRTRALHEAFLGEGCMAEAG